MFQKKLMMGQSIRLLQKKKKKKEVVGFSWRYVEFISLCFLLLLYYKEQ